MSVTPPIVGFDLAGTPFPHQVPALTAAFGSDHLVYGSDYCWTPAPAVAAQLAALDAAPNRPAPPGAPSPPANAATLLDTIATGQ